MLFYCLLFMLNVFAEPLEIMVEDHANIEVYISSPKIRNYTEDVEGIIGEKVVYGYSSYHWKGAKIINERGTYDPITKHSMIKVYDKDTIEYAWNNCNYLLNAKKCSSQNNHYLIETIITIDQHETHIQMLLYNPDMTLLSVSNITDRGEINYIKQQEIRMSMSSSRLDITIMPEKKPLKWVIPAHLLNKYIEQASKGLWLGVKIQ